MAEGNKNIFDFETVDSLPLLYHDEENLLVLSDLHLGLEKSMTSKGSYVPQFQLSDIIDDIKKAQDITGSSKILINGDLKNEFRRNHFSEKKEIRELLSFLEEDFEDVILIKGNHDTMLEGLVEEFEVDFEQYVVKSEVLFIHGHQSIEELDLRENESFTTIVIGHEHPALALKDDVGVKEKVDCFLYGQTDQNLNIIVLPAFAKVSSGTRINETPQSKLLSPVLRNSVKKDELKALGVSREAGILPFPEIGKIS